MILAKFIATGFFSGLLKPAPGTWGSLVAIGIVYMIGLLAPSIQKKSIVAVFLIVSIVGTYATHLYIQSDINKKDKDPSEVVIDEWAGQILTFILVPINPYTLLAGFILFRFFDISKLWPISAFEKIKGAAGIMLDDIVAGLFAAVTLRILYEYYLK